MQDEFYEIRPETHKITLLQPKTHPNHLDELIALKGSPACDFLTNYRMHLNPPHGARPEIKLICLSERQTLRAILGFEQSSRGGMRVHFFNSHVPGEHFAKELLKQLAHFGRGRKNIKFTLAPGNRVTCDGVLHSALEKLGAKSKEEKDG